MNNKNGIMKKSDIHIITQKIHETTFGGKNKSIIIVAHIH